MIEYQVYDKEYRDYLRFETLEQAKEYVDIQVNAGYGRDTFIIFKRELVKCVGM